MHYIKCHIRFWSSLSLTGCFWYDFMCRACQSVIKLYSIFGFWKSALYSWGQPVVCIGLPVRYKFNQLSFLSLTVAYSSFLSSPLVCINTNLDAHTLAETLLHLHIESMWATKANSIKCVGVFLMFVNWTDKKTIVHSVILNGGYWVGICSELGVFREITMMLFCWKWISSLSYLE